MVLIIFKKYDLDCGAISKISQTGIWFSATTISGTKWTNIPVRLFFIYDCFRLIFFPICGWQGSWLFVTEKVVESSPTNPKTLKQSHNSWHIYLTVVLSSWLEIILPHHHHLKGQIRLSEVILLLCETDCDKRICWCTIDEVSPEWLWRQPLMTNKTLRGYPPLS